MIRVNITRDNINHKYFLPVPNSLESMIFGSYCNTSTSCIGCTRTFFNLIYSTLFNPFGSSTNKSSSRTNFLLFVVFDGYNDNVGGVSLTSFNVLLSCRWVSVVHVKKRTQKNTFKKYLFLLLILLKFTSQWTKN